MLQMQMSTQQIHAQVQELAKGHALIQAQSQAELVEAVVTLMSEVATVVRYSDPPKLPDLEF